ncbi:13096_t:CDS:2 [Ambispora gerdemannii]|uniref:13096_t:CDS:1 n=1 Tax=Ambispora gerdemannii TaxID=144530 RepID=A0A9N8WMN7_9GLOM|nr:13096_t:CDS:2 [Ambispora gerdemannii]
MSFFAREFMLYLDKVSKPGIETIKKKILDEHEPQAIVQLLVVNCEGITSTIQDLPMCGKILGSNEQYAW